MTNARRILLLTAAGVCFLWNLFLFIFLLSSKSGAIATLCSITGALASGFIYICVRNLFVRLPLSAHRRRGLFTVGALAVCLVVMLSAPYSPAHDSHDMSGFLSTFVNKTTLSTYADKYLSFYGTNRMCMYFYKPLVEVFSSVQVGSTVSNIIFLLTSVYCISDIVYKKFGIRYGEISLFLLPQFVPYMMMSGPYIYPPAVFLSSVALCLFFSHRIRYKIISAVLFGLLTVMRPTAAAAWVILMVLYLILRGAKNIINNICFTIVLLLVCLCTQTSAHNIMYANGSYPYPNFTNSAMQWTLELGLRPQGTKTGKCTYSAISGVPFDEICKTFRDLWDAYEGADDNETYRIKVLNQRLNKLIAERAVNTVFSDAESFFNHIGTKYKNMFSDEYKAYYYTINISDKDFEKNIYKNYEWRYFLSENTILVSFAIASMILCIFTAFNVYRRRQYPIILLCLSLAVMAMFCGFILLTEIGKRLMFDMYTPMCIVICAMYSQIIDILRKKIPKTEINLTLCTLSGLLAVLMAQSLYSMYNAEPFKNCLRSYTSEDGVVITLAEPYQKDGYMLWLPEGRDVHLKGRQNITLPLKKDDRQNVALTLPDGKIQYITNYELKK